MPACNGCTIMTKITIVDYFLEIVIVIINNRFMPLFEVTCHIDYIFIKRLKTLFQSIAFLYIEPQMSTIHWVDFFFKQKMLL